MGVGLLVYTHKQIVYKLDEGKSPQHSSHLHTNKLHK
jgi:hypothetical protein